MEQREFNDFTFSGIISTKPVQKPIQTGTLVETTLENTSTYREKVTTTTLPITGWHDVAKKMLTLKVGDHCVVRGKVKTTAYTTKSGDVRNIINMIVDALYVTTKSDRVQDAFMGTATAPGNSGSEEIPF